MQPLLTTLYRRQADRPNLGTNANQIPTTIYIKTAGRSSFQCNLCDAAFASVTHLKMHKRSLMWAQMPIRIIFTKAEGAEKQIFFIMSHTKRCI